MTMLWSAAPNPGHLGVTFRCALASHATMGGIFEMNRKDMVVILAAGCHLEPLALLNEMRAERSLHVN